MRQLKKFHELEVIKGLEAYQYSTDFPPKWFDIDNYRKVVSRSSAAWKDAVYSRRFLKIRFSDDGIDDLNWGAIFMISFHEAQRTLQGLHFLDSQDELGEAAIIDMDAFDYSRYLAAYLELAPDLPLDEILDYDSVLNHVPPSGSSESLEKQYELIRKLPIWKISSEIRSKLFSNVDSLVPNFLDVAAPDDVIAKSAVEYARKVRAELGLSNLKQRISAKDMEKWADQKLLAYIDLMIWFDAVGFKPPLHQIADLLFSDKQDVDVSEFLRKTVRKNAQVLMNESTNSALVAQSGENL